MSAEALAKAERGEREHWRSAILTWSPAASGHRSLRLQPCGFDHLAPPPSLGIDECPHLRGRAADRLDIEARELLADVRLAQGLVHGLVQHGGDASRRAWGRTDGVPGVGDDRHAELAKGRNVLEHVGTPLGGDGQDLGAPGTVQVVGRRQLDEDQVDLARHQVGERGCNALVGHVRESCARHRHEQLGGQMRRSAHAGRGVVQLARIRLQIRDRVLHRARREVGPHHQRVGKPRHHGHRLERGRIEINLLEQRLVGGEDVGRGRQERVAVRLGAKHRVGRDIARGARLVLDDERLPQPPRHLVRHDAGHRIDAPAGGNGHHDPDRPARIRLRLRARDAGGQQRDRDGRQMSHAASRHGAPWRRGGPRTWPARIARAGPGMQCCRPTLRPWAAARRGGRIRRLAPARSENAAMAEPAFSTVIRGGTAVLATGVARADIGIRGETIAAIGKELGAGEREIDATGRVVAPGGVDPHAHIEQVSGGGLLNADSFESATVSAAFGGTTTVIPFAAQHVGHALDRVLDDYHRLAEKGAVIDYAFHMILADPNEVTLKTHIPKLVREGHASIKVFMTYDRIKLDDEQLLNVVHAENHGMITFMVKRLLAHGMTTPPVFGMSHPRLAEVDAIQRLVVMSRFIDQPVMIFHVSTAEGANVVRRARADGVKIFGETCPHYLLLTDEAIQKPGLEGAKWMCSPPLRTGADQEALWQALARGDLQVVSSDHAPYRFDASGKLSAGPNPTFKEIANGLPGLQVRLPVLFDAMVTRGRLSLEKFVALTSEAPAKIYGLYPKKGTLAIGSDADIAIWNAKKSVRLSASIMHDRSGYTPYEGLSVTGWPEIVLSRGR